MQRKPNLVRLAFAFYPDIQSIDTVFGVGIRYCPFMMITKKDHAQFKISIVGKKG
jgi:hypothetical protein